MSAQQLLREAERAGGKVVLRADGRAVAIDCPDYLIQRLKRHRDEVITLLRQANTSSFPHCPRCTSYALYRANNIGTYECETCGMIGIAEAVARRTH